MQEIIKDIVNQFIGLAYGYRMFSYKYAGVSFLFTNLCQCPYLSGRNGAFVNHFITYETVGTVHRDVTVYQSPVLYIRQIVDNRFGASCGNKDFNAFFVGNGQCLDGRCRNGMSFETHQCSVNIKKQGFRHIMFFRVHKNTKKKSRRA